MKVVIATTTYYEKMNVRAKLALRMLEEARNLSYEVAVVDGGSCGDFLRACLAYEPWPRIQEQKQKGMGPSRRQAMREAATELLPDDAVLWNEPEKWPMVSQVQTMADKMKRTGAHIIVPTRRSMHSYPSAQRGSEEIGNLCFEKATGRKLDAFVGTRLVRVDALPYFEDYRGEYGDEWDSIFIPLVRAAADGLIILPCDVDYNHPPEQKEEEENDRFFSEKRIRQLHNVVPAVFTEARRLGLMKN